MVITCVRQVLENDWLLGLSMVLTAKANPSQQKDAKFKPIGLSFSSISAA